MDMEMRDSPTADEDNQLAMVDSEVETQPAKRRKKKSLVWDHFVIEDVGSGNRRAFCKQCKQSFAYSTGSKVAGTSHLKRHIDKGTCAPAIRTQDDSQLTPYTQPASSGTSKKLHRIPGSSSVVFDTDHCRHVISNMIILHEYPLHMVEHSGFVTFSTNLQPRFDMVTFNIIQGDCVATYLREKQTLMKRIEGIPGRISLALDLWTSGQTMGYVFLTGYYVDSDWKSHRRLLNVVMEPYPDSDTAFSHAIAACLSDWSLESKLFSVTVNQPLSDTAIENVRAQLSIKNTLVLNGQLLLQSCLARTLSTMAKDVLEGGRYVVKKVRDSVKYVKFSDVHEDKFLEIKQQLQVSSTRSVSVDNKYKWNTTYEMLLAALELKEVFSCLQSSDPGYKEAPTAEEWKQVEILCSYLKLFVDAANIIASQSVPTANTYFHEVCKIHMELGRAAASDDPFLDGFVKLVKENFDKYWKNCCLILAMAVVIDPRFKMKLVEFTFTKVYGEDADTYIKYVNDGIHELFNEYLAFPRVPNDEEDRIVDEVKNEKSLAGTLISCNGLADFDVFIMKSTSQQSRSELDMYLEESLLPRLQDFDVLNWWKLNRTKYPVLSNMARDILSCTTSTVSCDAVFDSTSKEMDRYRSSLRPETVEALLCAKDWLQQELLLSTSANTTLKVESLI
uniref:BED-type domain-containing protein n=1 Tax=Kalanchoe fedtschenkoi TaxID=63787 RepID=A0A7N0VI31_KALFE